MNNKLQRLKERVKNRYALFVIGHSSFFDEGWYRSQVGNDLSQKESAAAHYLNGGWKWSDPSKAFNTAQYLQNNPDVAESGLCPLYHFERYGKREGGRSIPFYLMKGHYRSHRLLHAVRRRRGMLLNRRLIARNRSARILVCFQLFYPECWREVREYLQNLAPYSYDLVVTYQQRNGMQDCLQDVQAFCPSARLLPVDNVGFDLGGFQKALQSVDLTQYDIVFKIHSKGTNRRSTYVYHHYFGYRDWFVFLYEGILGASTVHQTIDRLMNDPTCGLVAADNLIFRDPPHKRRLLRKRLSAYPSIEIPPKYRYVAGTCFAQRASLLSAFANVAFDFTPSRRGEFSLAHALERAVCFSAQQNGYQPIGFRICRLRRAWCRIMAYFVNNDRVDVLLQDPRFDLDDYFVLRDLEHLHIKGYTLTSVRLGDIRRRWYDGTIAPLTECAPYRYLCGDTEAYDRYCTYYEHYHLYPVSRETFDALYASIKQNGFDTRRVVVLREDYTIIDGQHRACCLIKLYGEDYSIPAVILQ